MSRTSRTTAVGGRVGTLLAVFMLLLCALGVAAHSTHSPPIKRVHHPSRSTLRILPRHIEQNGILKRSRVAPAPETVLFDDTLLLTASIPSLLPYDVHLLVTQTEHLFHPDAKIVYQNADGETTHTERLNREDWALYAGNVIRPSWVERIWEFERLGYGRNPEANLGSASVMVHEVSDGSVKWEGMFEIGGETYNVLTRENYDIVKTEKDIDVAEEIDGGMVVFTERDMEVQKRSADDKPTCGHDRLAYNTNPFNPARVRRDVIPRLLGRGTDMGGSNTPDTNYINNIGSSQGCPTEAQVVYAGVMLDCTYTAKFGSTGAARTNVLNKWNMVTNLYKNTFKISLGIIELQVRDTTCPTAPSDNESWNVDCESQMTLEARLNSFSRWRGNKGDDGAGLWHLLTDCQSDTEVGIAWLASLCQSTTNQQSDGTWVSGTGVSTATTTEWGVIAHEIGHIFGAIHDCTSGCSLTTACCPGSSSACDAGGQYIMNPTTAAAEQNFSPCTLGNVCTYIATNSPKCVVSPSSDKTIISLNACGNGILEDGEECDPGNDGNSACCENCKLRTGMLCDPTNGACCTDQCQYASQGTVCRPALNDICDTAETCTGTNSTCPTDITAEDGKNCGNGLTCASGHCTSLDRQCQISGSSLNLTNACGAKNDKTCVVSCKDPTTANTCQILQTVLIDGSECGYGGRCYNGTCKSGKWTEVFDAMYTQNLQISIPVTIAVGLVVFAIIYQIITCCCCRRRPKPPKRSNMPMNNRASGMPPPLQTNYMHINEPLLSAPIPAQARPHSGVNHQRGPGGSGSGSDISDGINNPPQPQGYADPYAQQYNTPYNPQQSVDYSRPGHGYNASADYDQYRPPSGTQPGRDHWVDESAYNGTNYRGGY